MVIKFKFRNLFYHLLYHLNIKSIKWGKCVLFISLLGYWNLESAIWQQNSWQFATYNKRPLGGVCFSKKSQHRKRIRFKIARCPPDCQRRRYCTNCEIGRCPFDLWVRHKLSFEMDLLNGMALHPLICRMHLKQMKDFYMITSEYSLWSVIIPLLDVINSER